jgi:hypothetical protein
MSKVIINKGKGLRLDKTSAPNSTPEGVDYESLMDKLNKQAPDDLRKNKNSYSLDQIDQSNTTNKLTKETVIPVPGLLVNYEDSQQGTYPRPTDGPVIPGGGLNWGGEF